MQSIPATTIQTSKLTPLNARASYVCDQLLRICNHSYGKGKLVLIGGIQINLPAPYADHFQPKFFQVLSSESTAVDLLPELSHD